MLQHIINEFNSIYINFATPLQCESVNYICSHPELFDSMSDSYAIARRASALRYLSYTIQKLHVKLLDYFSQQRSQHDEYYLTYIDRDQYLPISPKYF